MGFKVIEGSSLILFSLLTLIIVGKLLLYIEGIFISTSSIINIIFFIIEILEAIGKEFRNNYY